MKEFKICDHHCHLHSRNALGGDSKIGSGTKPHCCRWIRAGPLSHGSVDAGHIPCKTRIWHTHTITERAFWHCILSQGA